jgi:hypothetical protein
MTRDEVMALTDEELRIKAAELAGWKKLDEPETIAGWMMHGTLDCWWKNGDRLDVDPPDYPCDIAAAWELLLYAKKLDDATWAGRTLAIAEWFSRQSSADDWADSPSWELKEVLFNRISPRELTRSFVLAMTQEKP